jgi:hypothetical protein
MEAENGRKGGTLLVEDGCNVCLTAGLSACEAAASGVWAGIR